MEQQCKNRIYQEMRKIAILIRVRFCSAIKMMATVVLVTTLCWWLYDGDRIKMLVTETPCCRLFFILLMIF